MISSIQDLYFNWLCDLIKPRFGSYNLLLEYLDRVAFNYTIPPDANREEDGINLRYRFGQENGYDDITVCNYLDNRPCSILEMMVALCIRCENIMEDLDVGVQYARWFSVMLSSLNLLDMTDEFFDLSKVNYIIEQFQSRTYLRNGSGGLFTTNQPNIDMRALEIWDQMSVYLNENYSFQ